MENGRRIAIDEAKARKLIELLIDTQWAHHEHQERDLDGQYNYEWPVWYTDFLMENGLPGLLGKTPSKEDLIQFLYDVDKQHRSENPNQDWPVFYAIRMLDWA